ncbi:MAG TPA: hypothetical protein VHX39_27155 [Acetobacteraceae bacterium]|jgi:hypothetical protein|nr:hypothetical protein [Acetobacteraceae bacterium]
MSVISAVASGVQGALMLARGRPEGIERVEADQTAVIHSFWAIPLSLPAVVCLQLLDWLATGIPANVPEELSRYLMLFLIGWLAFVWLSHGLAKRLHRQPLWPRFIAIWAYCSIIENTLVAIGALPGALGAPTILDEACQLITMGWALWLEWYAIRLSLQVGPLIAVLLLLVDFGIGAILNAVGALAG